MADPSPDAPAGIGLRDDFASHPVATIVTDGEGVIRSANARAESLLNMARSALVGSNIGRVLRVADQSMDVNFWRTDKPLSAYDVRIQTGRQPAQDMDILINPLSAPAGWRVIALHVHGQPMALGFRRTPSASLSAVGAAAMLAHEIKNPLSGIRGAAQLMEGAVSSSEQHLIQLIVAEVDRIAALIDRMQGFTTVQPPESRSQNVYPPLNRSIDIAQAGFASDVAITRDFDPSLPEAIVDADRLVQILINLLKNAAEAVDGRKDGRVIVSTAFRHGFSVTRSGGGHPVSLPIEIQVMDNGPGVPNSIIEVLFNPFITTKRKGQGLGLALVDKLMRDMGGLVQYERLEDAKGEGWTVFRLLLPMGGRK